ncbi:hypothetical protein Trydic_g13444 [Trypoxylus dichotomus]
MDPGFHVQNDFPKKNANILSKTTFAWMARYFYKAVKKGIETSDLFRTDKANDSEILGNKLQVNWEKELEKARKTGKEPSLIKALADTFLWSYMVYGIFLLIQAVGFRIFQPQVLGYLLRLFTGAEDVEDTMLAKMIAGTILVVIVILTSFIMHHTNVGQQSVGMKVRVSVSTLVYRKMLRLNKQSLGETAAGKVVNLLANDVSRFDFVAIALHYFWITPIQVILVSYFMWDAVDIAALAGILSMLLFTLPLQIVMGKLSSKYRSEIAVRTDYRVRLMNEIVSGIQVIKMYAWEKPFEKLVSVARLDEVRKIKAANYVRAVFLSSMVFVERTTLFLTLITFVLIGNNLTSDITYTIIPYINLLQTALAIFLPLAIQMSAECAVSIRRLSEFLLLDEVKETNIVKTDNKAIEVRHVSAKWTEEAGALHDLSFKVPAGKLCALIGPVGAGKSSTLQLLLGELPTDAGEIRIGGEISYAAQEPWLFSSSVKGNILFGQEYDKHRYNKVIKVCALEKDFNQFPYGDSTLVGEKGVSLSGGQRARINLARAVYREADMYFLDDPLSAVDAHVGKSLFDECVMGYLATKTRILVTHQLQYLKRADVIVVFNNGRIEAQGTFDELSRSNTDFTKMLIAADETIEKPEEKLGKGDGKTLFSRQESAVSVASASSVDQKEVTRQQEEVIIPGKSVLWDYIDAVGNICVVAILLLIILLIQVIASGNDYFVSWWTEQEEYRFFASITPNALYDFFTNIENSMIHAIKYLFGMNANVTDVNLTLRATEDEYIDTNIAIYIYSGLIVGLILFTVIRSYLFFKCASTASTNLHGKMFTSLLKAPMRFFDTNPSGRVLNRFSKDTGSMDEVLPRTLNETMTILLSLIGSITLICVANYWMAIPVAVLLIVFFFLRGWYMTTAKSIRHVEGIVKSPVFSLLNSTLSGISTIRASNYQNDLIKEFDRHQNVHTSAWILSISCMASFGLWLDLLCALMFAAIVYSFVVISETVGISGAMAGLAISQSLSLSFILQYGMRQIAEVASQLTSVERIMTYTKLDQEGSFESPKDKKPAIEWPDKGKISFKNMSLRYVANEAPVLKNLNIQIHPGEKIGIVGRTGAGKSSLIQALFRLALQEGSISIDDLDTQHVGLHDVRSKISIIPQEPVLFSASMRYNLDPFEEYSDQDLWSALTEVELKEAIPSLDYKVAEGGSNFSVGQRQLICLARAIVRKNRILVLDEATANVDPRTDGLIQATIRKKFKECTVLTIAHRLNTIMDSDRVLFMDTGRVSEFDHPHLLLQDSNGHFTKLVSETGPSMTATLREIALRSYEERWMIHYFYKGSRQGIDTDDLFKTQSGDDSESIGDRLEANWKRQLEQTKGTDKKPSLLRAIAATFLCNYMIYGIILFIQLVGLRSFQPQILAFLLRLFIGAEAVDHIEDTVLAKYLTALVLVVVVLISAFIMHHTNLGQQLVGMRVRIAVSTLVYRKMLKLSKRSLGETAAGKVVNLLANDVTRFDFVAIALHYFWITPFQVIVVAILMWDAVGVSSLSGILSMLMLTLPIQVLMGKLSSKFRGKVAVRTDYRVRLMNEIISGIQVIKMYAWEKPFEKLVSVARIDEVKMVRFANYVRAVFLSSLVFIERTTLYLTLITFVLTGNPLTSDITYILTPYFNLLQMGLAIFLPLAIQMSAEALVSIRRLTEFLLLDELKESIVTRTEDKSIEVQNVNGRWTEESGILSEITFKVPAGKLCALIGPVGAGKSSTLQLLLGELPVESGQIKVGGSISYASQEAWLFGSTVRGNILFGKEFDRNVYNKVVQACALEKDFKQFPHGDNTLVGERGVSLSGGQRARINLARAVYRSADIYLLDDPLSAVDTHVGKHLFEECIMGYLGSKTRILVTHQLQYLKRADLIIVFNNGRIEAQGTFAELSKETTDFTKMLVAADETTEKEKSEDAKPKLSKQESVISTSSNDNEKQNAAKQSEEEMIIPGRSVLWDYIAAAGSSFIIALIIFIIIVSQVVSSGNDFFVSWWTEQEEGRHFAGIPQTGDMEAEEEMESIIYHTFAKAENAIINAISYVFGPYAAPNEPSPRVIDEDGFFNTYVAIYIYTGLIIGLISLTILRSFLFFRSASNSSKNLHAKMFNCLLKTPMRFFDTNPSGRILNRFSKDTGAMDESLPRILSEAIQIMLTIVGAIVLISIANYWMLIPIVVLLVIFYFLRGVYMLTAKSIKHIEGIAKSPVFSLLNSTLGGISTIRAANLQHDLIKEFDHHQNAHTSAWILTITCMVAFGLWLDLLCTLFVALTVFSFVFLSESGVEVSPALAGLAISQSLSLAGMLQYGMRQTAEVVNQLISVERIMSYTKLDQEGPFDTPKDKKPAPGWPDKGEVKFRDMSLRYAVEEDPVLNHLNVEIQPGEKIGIVGRTGAGKSSLISALFRLAPLEGSITVDDLDTQQIGLHDVRSKISIIPQEPVLFSAPMRYNLDPFDEFSDQDLWAALDEVQLKEAVPSLDYKVSEGGGNFSVGQRQLICLARAIIRNNKILVLDEATANVDPRTDGLIQATIRRKFKDCTVLTIAHRLNTIMDSDKVLVMDTGRIAEFDHPHLLLQNPEGHFTKLVMETGPTMTATLREIAEKSYDDKHSF